MPKSNMSSHWFAATIICAGLIVGLAENVYGQASAYRTGAQIICKERIEDKAYELVFASLDAQLGNPNASSLCLILLKGESKKMFCAYKIARDLYRDSSDGEARLIKGEKDFKDRLKEFVELMPECSRDDASGNLIAAMNEAFIRKELSAHALVTKAGYTPIPLSVDNLGEFPVITNGEAFPIVVHDYFDKLSLPADRPITYPSPGSRSAETANQRRQNSRLQDKNNSLNDDLSSKQDYIDTLVSDLWLWLPRMFFLLLAIVGYICYQVYSGLKKSLLIQRETLLGQSVTQIKKDEIRKNTFIELFHHLRDGSQQPEVGRLGEIVDDFTRSLDRIEDKTSRTFPDGQKIQEELYEGVRKCVSKLGKIPEEEGEYKWWHKLTLAKRRNSRLNAEIKNLIDTYVANYSNLRSHNDDVINQYKTLYWDIRGQISELAVKAPSNNMTEETHAWQGRNDLHSGQESFDAMNPTWAQDISRRLNTLNQQVQSNFKRQEAELRSFERMNSWRLEREDSLRDRSLLENDERFEHWVKRMAHEQEAVLKLLPEYQPRSNRTSVKEKVEAIEHSLASAVEVITTEASLPTDKIDQLAIQVVKELTEANGRAKQADALKEERDRYRARVELLEPEVEAGRGLSDELVGYLGLSAERITGSEQPVKTILEKIKSESPEYRELRHRLLAVRVAFNKLKERQDNDRLTRLLQVDEWLPNLKMFLFEMQDLNPGELLDKGLYAGFSKGWLHGLLRADLLMSAYFAEDDSNFYLRDAVSQASAALRAALFAHGGKVVEIKLFQPAPDGVNKERDSEPMLRQFPEVKEKIILKYKESGLSNFVIDVLTFPFIIGKKRYDAGRVVIMNPNNWLQE